MQLPFQQVVAKLTELPRPLDMLFATQRSAKKRLLFIPERPPERHPDSESIDPILIQMFATVHRILTEGDKLDTQTMAAIRQVQNTIDIQAAQQAPQFGITLGNTNDRIKKEINTRIESINIDREKLEKIKGTFISKLKAIYKNYFSSTLTEDEKKTRRLIEGVIKYIIQWAKQRATCPW